MRMKNEYLRKAIEIVGGQSALARACGGRVKQQHVWNWLHRDGRVPAQYVLAVERATRGQITRQMLRPDIYPGDSDPDERPGYSIKWDDY